MTSGGTAGSHLSALRARPGCRVLLLDRADFPRDKSCGDGVAPHALVCGALTLTATGYVSLFSATTMPVALAAATLIGLAGSVALGGTSTLVQRVTPNEVLGRVSAVLVTGEAVATLVGASAGGPMAQRWSMPGAAVVAAAVTVAGGLVAARFLPRTRLLVSG